MLHLFRLPPSSFITSNSFSQNCISGRKGCSHCFKHQTAIKICYVECSTVREAAQRPIVGKIKRSAPKKLKSELLKVTQKKTIQTTMPIVKLKASLLEAFANRPGMIVENIEKPAKKVLTKPKAKKKKMKDVNKVKVEVLENIENKKIISETVDNREAEIREWMRKKNITPTISFESGDSMSFSESQILPVENLELENVEDEVTIGSKFGKENVTADSEQVLKMGQCSEIENEETNLHTYYNVKNSNLYATENINQIVRAIVDVSVNSGLLEYAYEILKYKVTATNPEIYNAVIREYASNGDLNGVKDIMNIMMDKKVPCTCQTYALCLHCLSKVSHKQKTRMAIIILAKLESKGFSISDLFTKTTLFVEERENVLKMVLSVIPEFELPPSSVKMHSPCPLTADLYKDFSTLKSPLPSYTEEEIAANVSEQLAMESNVVLSVKSILEDDDPSVNVYRNKWNKLVEYWRQNIHSTLVLNLKVLKAEALKSSVKSSSIYPFMNCLPVESFVEIMVQEIRNLVMNSSNYSLPIVTLYYNMGEKVWRRFMVKKRMMDEKAKMNVMNFIESFCSWYANPSGPARNMRQKWQLLVSDNPDILPLEEKCIEWPDKVKRKIGQYIYNIMFRCTMLPRHIMGENEAELTPAFYLVPRYDNVKLTDQVKLHPSLSELCHKANFKEFYFDVSELPMVCPPKPWCSVSNGGYLILPTAIVRPTLGNVCFKELNRAKTESMYAVFDAVNQLQTVPWKINEPVLDTALTIFKSGGSKKLSVPERVAFDKSSLEINQLFAFNVAAYKKSLEKKKALQIMRDKYGLWCDGLYKLSLANHFRKRVFWLPQSMDFRGRVYPMPPHVNHISADLYRSLFLFARKEHLGKDGLDWLKLHAINLAGTHKKSTVEERLQYANDILPKIIDSGERPLDGEKWWMESDKPWQTLATCMEINNAIKSGNPETYKSGFPVHQDGSCNGLQHYAALGRDSYGAASVNLMPSEVPQDVYTVVTGIIEERRQKAAKEGVEIAKLLKGFITRKVVKQSIMTTVYGVTPYGAKLQIRGQLEDLEFDKQKTDEAATYITKLLFESLQSMFTSAKDIQDWFTGCANLITKDYSDSISWVTPIGLPVIQPYFKMGRNYRKYPDTMKQRNAFPPNFIHSLDSSHMMLTALYCEQAGVMFASVHDCFWTHPSTVSIMNKICREKFIAVHSQDILKNLSEYFLRRYAINGRTKEELKNTLISNVPKTGNFDLNSVMTSVYFFS